MRQVRGRGKIREMCADLLEDESGLSGAWCDLAVWPASVREAEDVINHCHEEGMKLTFSGGLTGTVGGALPDGGAVVSTSHLKDLGILNGGRVRAGAGVTLEELRSFIAAEAPGMFYPPDPTEETATIGGTLATDASGSDSFLYGSTRGWVEAVTVLIPGRDAFEIRRGEHLFHEGVCIHPLLGELRLPALRRRQPRKNAAGYYIRDEMDLLDLFLGSEGTLGLIAEAELRLAAEPARVLDLTVFPEDGDSFWKLYGSALRAPGPLRIRALEMMDGRCLDFMKRFGPEIPPPPDRAAFVLMLRAEADSEKHLDTSLAALEGLLADAGVDPDSVWGGFEPAERRRIRDFRHALPESVNRRVSELRREFPEVHKFGSDGAVPPSMLREYFVFCEETLKSRGLPFLIFGHAGQGHLHANALPDSPEKIPRAGEAMREIASEAVRMGGTVSAEHGLGRMKAGFLQLMYSEEEIAGMRRLRERIMA